MNANFWRDAIRRGGATFRRRRHLRTRAFQPAARAGLVESLLAPGLRALDAALASSIAKTLVRLHPEVITDVLLEHLGTGAARPLLHVLQGRPNAWHMLLAAALGTGCRVRNPVRTALLSLTDLIPAIQ